ncbi:NAD-dependent epimerase/dehydratase family protein [Candidatus Woesearchaeota archaeon]|nr:NAD-dependent epimerase/dehydratase family protein [Candidatus Woesearchaeota archaeon]
MTTYAVTGASGYVGSVICQCLRAKKHTVIELGRNFKQKFVLGEEVYPSTLKEADVLVHCAWDFSLKNKEDIWRVNVEGSQKLLTAAKNIKTIFISTLSAFDGAKSLYGTAKLEVEKTALELGATVIRPGLIFGKNAGGMVGSLMKLTNKLRIIPVVRPRQHFHLCHVKDLAELIYHLSLFEPPAVPIVAACEKHLTFRTILKTLAKAQGKKIFLLPVPYFCAYLGLRTLELIGLNLGFRSDSLKGLRYVNENIDFEPTQKTQIEFREFNEDTAVE